MMDNQNDYRKSDNAKRNKYIVAAVLFVVVIIVIGITATYAYYKISIDTTEYKPTVVTGSTSCMDVQFSDVTPNGSLSLQYNYPISDEWAVANIRAYEVEVTNTCDKDDINYTLILTSLANFSDYYYTDLPEHGGGAWVLDDAIRIKVSKTLNNAESVVRPVGYLSDIQPLTQESNAYKPLMDSIESEYEQFEEKYPYVIDSDIAPAGGKTIRYKIYAWVDYYEGDKTHSGWHDNRTQDKNFRAAISLIANNSEKIVK